MDLKYRLRNGGHFVQGEELTLCGIVTPKGILEPGQCEGNGFNWTSAVPLPTESIGIDCNKIEESKYNNFLLKNEFENVVCEMAAIMFRHSC